MSLHRRNLRDRMRAAAQAIRLPVIVVAALAAILAAYPVLGLPTTDELLRLAIAAYSTYGYPVALMGAFAEAFFVAGLYFPGSTVVALGAVLARSAGLSLPMFIVMAVVGFQLAYLVDYVLGALGWYVALSRFGGRQQLDVVRTRIARRGPLMLLLLCIHPNLGALGATSSGLLRIRVSTFLVYTTFGTAFWTTVWALIVSEVGERILPGLALGWLLLATLAWLLVSFVRALVRS